MTLISRLIRVDLFSSLTDEELQRVAHIVKRVRYPRGHRICRQGETCTSFYILDCGEAIARAADDYGVGKPVGYFRPGRTLGQTSLLSGKPWEATVEATTDVELLRIDAHDFELLLSDSPALLDKVSEGLGMPSRSRMPRFTWQEPGERTVWFGHRHKYVLLGKLARPVLSALFLVAGFLLLRERFPDYPVLWLFLAFSVIVVLWGAWEWVDWANDHFVVTSRRVVHRELGLLRREERHEASLEKIQNLNVVRGGPVAQALGFGDIIIGTAAVSGGIIFDRISSPEEVRELIFQQVDRNKAWTRASEQEEIRGQLARRFGLAETGVPGMARTQQEEFGAHPPSDRRGILEGVRGWRSPFAVRIEKDGNVIWRKHWIALLREVNKPLILGLALVVLGLLPIGEIPFLSEAAATPYYLALALLGGCAFAWMWYQYEDWKNDLYMVTPDRIVDME